MSITKKTLKMVRSGEFNIHTYGDNHCGTAEQFKIRYHMNCECSSKLDDRGFLFDQINIQSFFESIQRTRLSCERLTVVCLEQLLEHILAENPTCQIYKMELSLSPEPFLASMVHTWENPHDPLTNPTNSPSGKVSKAKPSKATQNARLHRTNLKARSMLRNLKGIVDGSESAIVATEHDPKHDHIAPSFDHYVFVEPADESTVQ